ncbi:hypothetical protein OF001_U90077 [Pseudomonas sp. OF001]|nr:hypothetical protein OF001_U90077 [Pseudomonas sp. OF001]
MSTQGPAARAAGPFVWAPAGVLPARCRCVLCRHRQVRLCTKPEACDAPSHPGAGPGRLLP